MPRISLALCLLMRGPVCYGSATPMRGKSLTCRQSLTFSSGLRPFSCGHRPPNFSGRSTASRRLAAHRSGRASAQVASLSSAFLNLSQRLAAHRSGRARARQSLTSSGSHSRWRTLCRASEWPSQAYRSLSRLVGILTISARAFSSDCGGSRWEAQGFRRRRLFRR